MVLLEQIKCNRVEYSVNTCRLQSARQSLKMAVTERLKQTEKDSASPSTTSNGNRRAAFYSTGVY